MTIYQSRRNKSMALGEVNIHVHTSPTHVVPVKNRACFVTAQRVHMSGTLQKCERNMSLLAVMDITQPGTWFGLDETG